MDARNRTEERLVRDSPCGGPSRLARRSELPLTPPPAACNAGTRAPHSALLRLPARCYRSALSLAHAGESRATTVAWERKFTQKLRSSSLGERRRWGMRG